MERRASISSSSSSSAHFASKVSILVTHVAHRHIPQRAPDRELTRNRREFESIALMDRQAGRLFELVGSGHF